MAEGSRLNYAQRQRYLLEQLIVYQARRKLARLHADRGNLVAAETLRKWVNIIKTGLFPSENIGKAKLLIFHDGSFRV